MNESKEATVPNEAEEAATTPLFGLTTLGEENARASFGGRLKKLFAAKPSIRPAKVLPALDPYSNDMLDKLVHVPGFSTEYPKLASAQLVDQLSAANVHDEVNTCSTILMVRNGFRRMPDVMLKTNCLELLVPHLLSRSKLRRASAASAMAAMATKPCGRQQLGSDRTVLERLISMLRCGMDAMDTAMASLVIANIVMSKHIRDRLSITPVIKLLVWLVRHAVSKPVLNDCDKAEAPVGNKALVQVNGLGPQLVSQVEPKAAAVNAAAALCHMAQASKGRVIMNEVGLVQVLQDAQHCATRNALTDRCLLLYSSLMTEQVVAEGAGAPAGKGWSSLHQSKYKAVMAFNSLGVKKAQNMEPPTEKQRSSCSGSFLPPLKGGPQSFSMYK